MWGKQKKKRRDIADESNPHPRGSDDLALHHHVTMSGLRKYTRSSWPLEAANSAITQELQVFMESYTLIL